MMFVWGTEHWTGLWRWSQTNDPIVRSLASAINPSYCTTKDCILCWLCYHKINLLMHVRMFVLNSLWTSTCCVFSFDVFFIFVMKQKQFMKMNLRWVGQFTSDLAVSNENRSFGQIFSGDTRMGRTRKTLAEEDDTRAVIQEKWYKTVHILVIKLCTS